MEDNKGFVLGESVVSETFLADSPAYFALSLIAVILLGMLFSLWKDKNGR